MILPPTWRVRCLSENYLPNPRIIRNLFVGVGDDHSVIPSTGKLLIPLLRFIRPGCLLHVLYLRTIPVRVTADLLPNPSGSSLTTDDIPGRSLLLPAVPQDICPIHSLSGHSSFVMDGRLTCHKALSPSLLSYSNMV